MSNETDLLSKALSTRLGMQISLSSLPVVEEWMDSELGRWLDSVPMPPEMPPDNQVRWVVTVGSDFSRLRWSAHGHPGGFIPKMAEYLSTVKIPAKEVEQINELGSELQPALVGTWVGVRPGKVATGWHFLDEIVLEALGTYLGGAQSSARLILWAGEQDITTCVRYTRAIKDDDYTEISLLIPGETDAAFNLANSAFEAFGYEPIPEVVRKTADDAAAPEIVLAIRCGATGIDRVGIMFHRPSTAAVRELCGELGADFDDAKHGKLRGALDANGIEWVEFARHGASVEVDVFMIPGSGHKMRN